MASTGIFFAYALLLCLAACVWAAPSMDDSREFRELERTIKQLATSVLAMSGADGGGGGAVAGDGVVADFDADVMGSDAAEALLNLSDFNF